MSRTGWGTTKPPLGVPIDVSNPLTRGLIWALIFNEGGGAPYSATVPGDGKTQPTIGAGLEWRGDGLYFDSGSTDYVDLGNDTTNGILPFSVACRAGLNTTSGLLAWFGCNDSGGTERTYGSMYVEGGVLTYWVNTGGAADITGATALTTNRRYSAGVTRAGASGAWDLTLFLDGAIDATASSARSSTTTSAGNLRVGFAGAFATAEWDGPYEYFFLWNRALSPGEMRAVQLRPYDLFVPPAQSLIIFNQDTAGGAVQGSGTAAGTCAVDGIGRPRVQASGTSAGVGAATGVGFMRVQASGSADGTSTANGIQGNRASAAGTSAVDGVGVMRVQASGTSAGVGAATGIARFNIPSSGTSAGVGTATGVGFMRVQASGTSAGVGAATGVGVMRVQGSGTAAGVGTATGIALQSSGYGNAAGISAVDGIGNMRVQASGTSAGVGAATGIGNMRVPASGTSAGTGAATGIGNMRVPASGTSAGVGHAEATAQFNIPSSGTSAGVGAATGIGRPRVQASGTSAGTCVVDGRGPEGTPGTGSADGVGTASGVGVMRVQGSGTAAGTCTVIGIGRDGSATGTGGTKFFYGVGR